VCKRRGHYLLVETRDAEVIRTLGWRDADVVQGNESDGPLAEFVALRAEILQLNQQQNQMLALQLTIAGAVFGVAISHPGIEGILMVVPVVSYALCMRYLTNGMSILEIARYIREELDQRVRGGLRWEAWTLANSRENITYSLIIPLAFSFPGISLAALAWVVVYILHQSVPKMIGFLILWVVSAVAAIQQAALILRLRRGLWPSKGRS
jgi:hypothetical protein